MNFEEKVKLHYPLPVTQLYVAIELETDVRLKVQKQVELFEGVVRYLALIGLAGYAHYQLADSQVENLRPGLARPSLGHWVNLLKAVISPLNAYQLCLLGDNPDKNRNSDAIGEATRRLGDVLDQPNKTNRLKLHHFLTAVVEFRNKKFGHGSLAKPVAKNVFQPLQEALQLWLTEIPFLEQTRLVYLDRVEWQEPQFLYSGVNLNAGNYPTALSMTGNKGLTNDRVYLHQPANNELLPLHPFFAFDNDLRLLYVYNELSNQDKLLLRCPYETPSGEIQRYLDVNKTVVIGLGPTQTSTPNSSVEEIKPAIAPESPQVSPIIIEKEPQPEPENTPPVNIPDILAEPLPPPVTLPEVVISPPLTFDTLTEQLEMRIRQVCRVQARYPVLWITGAPCSGKTAIARAVCRKNSWRYIDFTLDPDCLDRLIGHEETYQPEDFLNYLRELGQTVQGEVIILDEIEPLLGWWSWDEQDVFFRKIAKATRLPCGVAVVTRLRSKQYFEKIAPGKNQVFEIPNGVEL